jgi:ABC-2 type transport system permease protein
MHLLRDPRNFLLVTVAPSFLLLTLAYVFTFDIDRFYIAVWDQDRTSLSRRYIADLLSDETLILQMTVASYSEIERALVRGQVRGALVIPSGFQRSITRREQVTVQAVVDGINPNAASQWIGQVQARTANFAVEEMTGGTALGVEAIQVNSRTWYNNSLKGLYSMVPGLLALVMCQPVFQIGQALTKEKETGTMEGLIAAPVKPTELMLGKLIPYLLAGLIGSLPAVAVSALWFRVPFRGTLALFILLTFDFLFASLSMGLLLANFLSSQQATMTAVFFVFFIPGFFLSGLLTPIDRTSIRSVVLSSLLPTTHYIAICRALFLKGVGLRYLWKPALSLLGIGLVTLSGSILTFRKRLV